MINKIDNYENYLKDESKFMGKCETISFPNSQEEIIDIAKNLWEQNIPITVQGAKTAISGSGIPITGHLMNIENVNNNIEIVKNKNYYSAIVDCGVRLNELNKKIRKELGVNYGFMPNPTEELATVSGMFSTNAKGTNYCLYGDFVSKVLAVKILLPDGNIIKIKRGDYILKNNTLNFLNKTLLLKNAINEGLYNGILGLNPNCDLIDIIGGSEGMLGIVLELELLIEKKPNNCAGIMFFFKNSNTAFEFGNSCRNQFFNNSKVALSGLEFFDKESIEEVSNYKQFTTKLNAIPNINKDIEAGIYVELNAESSDLLEAELFNLLDLFDNLGGLEENTWAGTNEEELDMFSTFRHAVPESINFLVEQNKKECKNILKIACDFKIDNDKFQELYKMYNKDILESNIKSFVFGHFYDCHLHVNLVPTNIKEIEIANNLIDKWAKFVNINGGSLAFENGVGKLKKNLISKYLDQNKIDNAILIKEFFDKNNLLNCGNMLKNRSNN